MRKWLVAILAACVVLGVYVLQAGESKYLGAKKCKMCHKSKKRGNQYGIWQKNMHAKAYETLASNESKKIAKERGISNPQKSDRCLRCHVVGGKLEEGVSCEACHGAAEKYLKSHKKDKEQAMKDGLIEPTEYVCEECHNPGSPTYRRFDYKKKKKTIAHPKPGKATSEESIPQYVGVKKCKTCHKSKKRGNQYGTWEKNKHAHAWKSLASAEAKKIAKKKGISDPQKSDKCVVCHVAGGGKSEDRYAGSYTKEEGVGCEACHGAGKKYIKSHKKNKEQAKKEGLIEPSEPVCKKCHNKESPTYKEFKYEETKKKIAHPKK